ncbi:MAG: hypothetical protein GF315_02065 [candidate division Zixibacteria bacterium]|nr:hypothetical protein [candidate division Zixibacteria bacterium]
MSEIKFRYQLEDSNIFASIKRPRVCMHVYSRVFREWIAIEDVLVDTGADLSILPVTLGTVLVGDIKNNRRFKITGLVSHTYMYLHNLSTKLNGKVIKVLFAIADTDDLPPTMGRKGALDKFDVTFQKGRTITFK